MRAPFEQCVDEGVIDNRFDVRRDLLAHKDRLAHLPRRRRSISRAGAQKRKLYEQTMEGRNAARSPHERACGEARLSTCSQSTATPFAYERTRRRSARPSPRKGSHAQKMFRKSYPPRVRPSYHRAGAYHWTEVVEKYEHRTSITGDIDTVRHYYSLVFKLSARSGAAAPASECAPRGSNS